MKTILSFMTAALLLCACNGSHTSDESLKDSGSVVVPSNHPVTSDTPLVVDSTRIDSTIKTDGALKAK